MNKRCCNYVQVLSFSHMLHIIHAYIMKWNQNQMTKFKYLNNLQIYSCVNEFFKVRTILFMLGYYHTHDSYSVYDNGCVKK
jgi:hypothetical protein